MQLPSLFCRSVAVSPLSVPQTLHEVLNIILVVTIIIIISITVTVSLSLPWILCGAQRRASPMWSVCATPPTYPGSSFDNHLILTVVVIRTRHI